MATTNIAYGTSVTMAVTALSGLTDNATVGWKSARVDNTTAKAMDYQVNVKFSMSNNAPVAPSALYIYAVPWYYDGSAWTVGADGGTTTDITDGDTGYTIGATNNLRPIRILTHTIASQVIYGHFQISSAFGDVPDGWSLVVINDSGATLTTAVVKYKPITYTTA